MQAKFKKRTEEKDSIYNILFLSNGKQRYIRRTYKQLENSLERLGGIRITKNLRTNKTSETNSFSLIEHTAVNVMLI